MTTEQLSALGLKRNLYDMPAFKKKRLLSVIGDHFLLANVVADRLCIAVREFELERESGILSMFNDDSDENAEGGAPDFLEDESDPFSEPEKTIGAEKMSRPNLEEALRHSYELVDINKAREKLLDESNENVKAFLHACVRPEYVRKKHFMVDGRHLDAVKDLRIMFPNMSELVNILIGSVRLAAHNKSPFRIPPLLLDGPPGIGKTKAIKAFCAMFNYPLIEINMGSLDGKFELAGGHRSYRDSEPGALLKKLMDCEYSNPIVLFDEAECGKDGLYQPIYHIVEDDTFEDNFLHLSFNTSALNFIFITNNKELLPAPLRSRLIEFDVKNPTKDEQVAIIKTIYREVWNSGLYEVFHPLPSSELVQDLLGMPLRKVRQAIEVGFINAAADTDVKIDGLNINATNIKKESEKQSIGFINH